MMLSASAATACAVSAAAAVEEAATAARKIELRKIALNIGQTHRQFRPRARPIVRPLGTHEIARAPAQPALSSCGFTPVRPAHPVRAKDDGDGQVSWLAGQRRSAAFSGPGSQWHVADGSPRTVAGAAGVFPFPLSPRCRGTCRLPRPLAPFGGRGQLLSGACFPSPPRRRGPRSALLTVAICPRLRGGDVQAKQV